MYDADPAPTRPWIDNEGNVPMLPRLELLAAASALVLSACASGPTIVRANQFEIVDSSGRVRGTFGCSAFGDQPFLTIMDEESVPMVLLGVTRMEGKQSAGSKELGPVFHLESVEGNSLATISVHEGGVLLNLESGENRSVEIELGKDSTVITTTDGEGREARAKLTIEKGALHLEPIAPKEQTASTDPSAQPSANPSRAVEPAGLSPRELDVLEAVFRYQFEHNRSGTREPDCIFLALAKRSDPPPELLARFADHVPPVEPVSAADPEGSSGVHRPRRAEHGIIFGLTAIQWIDEDTVEVDGGYYEASRSASKDTYRVERKDGKWVVVSDKLHWIS
jgi:hypothetical protein